MSIPEWEKICQDAWAAYYTPDHIETVMRRSVATRSNPGNMLLLLIWFYGCVILENVHPLQGGYLRRKYRTERRPGLPMEAPWIFYPRYAGELVSKHIRMARLIWRFGRFRMRLKRDPEAQRYSDVALTPVSENELNSLEMFTIVAGAGSAHRT